MDPVKASTSFHVMIKPGGAVCNMACAYCYYLEKASLFPGSESYMTQDVLDTFTRQYIEAQPIPQADFAWQGGEPTLLGLDFFQQAIALQKRYAPFGFSVSNSLQTNGTRLTPAWCRFFKENQFLVGLSLDGPPDVHNAYRRTPHGGTDYEGVMRAVRLLQEYAVDFNVLCCVHAANVDQPRRVYRYLRDRLGVRFMQFIPIVEPFSTMEVPGPHSVSGRQYGQFLRVLFDEWLHRDVGQVFVQLFDVALGVWSGYPAGLCVFAPTCGRALVLEHNGDVFSCDHFVDPNHRLGNIMEQPLVAMVESDAQKHFGHLKEAGLAPECLDCPVGFICQGGCPRNRRPVAGESYSKNVLCEGYREFFMHIDDPMRIMARQLKGG